jgi:response regulator RpfG family c-di-GMP phosphodiesterase
VLIIETQAGVHHLLHVDKDEGLSEVDQRLLELFCTNLGVALDNLRLLDEIARTEQELVETIGNIAESRSLETGQHVKRVAAYSALFAQHLNLPAAEVELIRLASPLHDLGKVAIPDAILGKKGPHTDDERRIMRTHAELGYCMLTGANSPVLQAGAIIALDHHEWWNGCGYPRQLTGDAIHIYGRIVAVADVFDALLSRRAYKEGWPVERVIEYFTDQRGKHFDPTLVDILIAQLPAFLHIYEAHP